MKAISYEYYKANASAFALVCLLIFTSSGEIIGQDNPHPVYQPFVGHVVELPVDSLSRGYRPYVASLDPIDTIVWDELMVRVRKTVKPFPDVSFKEAFGIIWNSEMEIEVDGYYEFILASDDGSKLWIKDDLIIDNDFIHPMKVARDTVQLRRGSYPIKLWYYQAMLDRYGFIFQGRFLRPLEGAGASAGDSLVWDGDILFGFDNHELSSEGIVLLDELISHLETSQQIQEIKVMGHTDDIGSHQYNQYLSQRRAQSILSYLESYCDSAGIKYSAIGYGEEKPRVPNTSSQNRAKNRRVEFLIN